MAKTLLDRILVAVGGPDAKLTEQREAVARECGVTRQAVEQWADNGIPPKHVFTLERATRGTVTAREIMEWSERVKAAA